MTTRNEPVSYDIAPDWLSFSMPIAIHPTEAQAFDAVHRALIYTWPELAIPDTLTEKARAPYKASIELTNGGRVMFNHLLNHFLIEVSGKGCRHLHDSGQFAQVATRALKSAINITRFDVAVDLQTDTDPEQFATQRSGRFAAHGLMESDTGKTYYVGAPTGRRRARVYRYYPPHDRSHLLRVEMVARKGLAQEALKSWLSSAPEEYASRAGASYGWEHGDWRFDTNAPPIRDWRPETGDANTLRWLMKAVLPAVERMYRDGSLPLGHPFWVRLSTLGPLDWRKPK